MRFIFIILLFAIFLSCDSALASLFLQDLNAEKTERTTENKLNEKEKIKRLMRINIDKATVMANQLLEKAISKNDSMLIADAHKLIGTAYFYQNKYQQAFLQFLNAMRIAKMIGYESCESDAMYNLSLIYSNRGKYAKARSYCKRSLKIDKELGNRIGEATSLNCIGITYENENQFSQALIYYHKSIDLKKQLGDIEGIANSLQNIGNVYKKTGHFHKALDYLTRSEKFARQAGDSVRLGRIMYTIGEVYEHIGKYDNAFEYYMDVINHCKKINDKHGEAFALNNIGNVYKGQNLYDNALENYNQALTLMQTLNDKNGVAIAYDNIGNIYELKGDFDIAINYYKKANTIKEQIRNISGLAATKNNIGNVHVKQKKFEKALKYYQEAYQIRQNSNENSALANAAKNLGYVLINLKRYDEAEKYLLQAFRLASETNSLQLQKNSAALLAELYSIKNIDKQALKYYKKYVGLKDSVSNIESRKKLAEMRTKYETEKKTQENKLLTKENELKAKTIAVQNLIGVGIFIIALIAGISAFIFFRARVKEKRINIILRQQKQQIESQAEELKQKNVKLIELDKFKQGMTSMLVHDLKNPLNLILNIPNNLSIEKRLETIKQTGQQMLNMVLNILDVYKSEETRINLIKTDVTLSNLIYKSLSQVSFLAKQKNINIHDRIEDKTTGLHVDSEIVIRILVNLLTNAIKYSPINGNIWVNSYQATNDFVKLSVKDSGQGIPDDQAELVFEKFKQTSAKKSGEVRSTGLGLTFCKMAVEAHKGVIGVDTKTGEGAEFWFTVPVAKDFTPVDEEDSQKLVFDTKEDKIILSEEDKQILKPLIENIKGYEVYEITRVNRILDGFETSKPGIMKWKEELLQALFNVNEKKYQEMLDLFD